MKGYWYFISLTALVASLTTSFSFLFSIVFLIWILWLYRKRRVKKRLFLLAITSLLFFTFLFRPTDDPPLSNSLNEESQLSSVFGNVVSPINDTLQKIEFTLEEESTSQNILVTLFKSPNNTTFNFTPKVKYGAICTIKGIKELPPQSRNPGQFNYQKYLSKQNIIHQIVVETPENIQCQGSSKISVFYDLREKSIEYVRTHFSEFSASWILALIFGDDSTISYSVSELFQHWNLSHLLAISGLHVGLIVTLISLSLVKVGLVTKEKASWVIILFLPLYAILAGGAPPVWRAAIMTLIALLLLRIRIKLGILDIFSFVFMLFILFDKSIISNLGFQFSFIVTVGLLLSKSFFQQSKSRLFLIFKISFLSQLILLPLQSFHFYFINPLSLFTNLLMVPYFTIIVIPFILIMFLISFVFPVFTPILDRCFTFVHDFVLKLIQMIDNHFFFPWVLGEFPIQLFSVYFFMFILLMASLTTKKLKQSIIHGCLLVIILVYVSIAPYLNPNGTITMLDVGQGDAFVIELPFRKQVILVDAAGSMSADFESISDKTYNQIIKPFLYSKGISKLDAIFLSHEDTDHIGSLAYLINEFTIEEIIVSNHFKFTKESLLLLEQQKVKLKQVHSGDQLNFSSYSFYVLQPSQNYGSTNDNSLVLYSEIGGLNWLFTGDIGKSVEEKLVRHYPNLKVDVLKLAHHGSKGSTSDLFLTKINPKIAWISVGGNNRYGHPNKEVIEALEKNRIKIMRTDKNGAIIFEFYKDTGTFFKFLP